MTALHGPPPKRGDKALFSRFFDANPDLLHAAAHSHHPWPDVSFEAQQQAWLDAVQGVDRKWAKVFGERIPAAHRQLAHVLGLPDPATLCLGASVHQFMVSMISTLDGFGRRPMRIVTTDAEFHSASRQLARFAEAGLAHVDVVAAQPLDSFRQRLGARLAAGRCAAGADDFVLLSHVHFDSGYVVEDLAGLAAAVPADVPVLIDGYHSFMALPVDLSSIADRAFYTAGGYKYAMSGENAAFLHAPDGWMPRPVITGWFSGFSALQRATAGEVFYDEGGARFMGATFDPVGAYRLEAVLSMLRRRGWSPGAIHRHVVALQAQFIDRLAESVVAMLLPPIGVERGNFLTFLTQRAPELDAALAGRGVVVDHRRDRLRIGLGIYHDEADVDRLAEIVTEVWPLVTQSRT